LKQNNVNCNKDAIVTGEAIIKKDEFDRKYFNKLNFGFSKF